MLKFFGQLELLIFPGLKVAVDRNSISAVFGWMLWGLPGWDIGLENFVLLKLELSLGKIIGIVKVMQNFMYCNEGALSSGTVLEWTYWRYVEKISMT